MGPASVCDKIILRSVVVRDFRILEHVDFQPGAGLNVLVGDNGQGKTSLLEAVYFLATSKSFRTQRLREVVRDHGPLCSVRAEIQEGNAVREQRAAVESGKRQVTINGKKPDALSDYAVRTPVVIFHPGDLELVNGPELHRRLLLDRIALFVDPLSAVARSRFAEASRDRQRILETSGPRSTELDAFETLIAQHGSRLARGRRLAYEQLQAELPGVLAEIASFHSQLEISYQPGGSESESEYRSVLASQRHMDLLRKRAMFGPHRDRLSFFIQRRDARQHASQGQQRLLTLGIKAAELASIRKARAAHPLLLLDDISSELDPSRTGAVYRFVRKSESQVFVTTTRPELLGDAASLVPDRRDWTLESGQILAGKNPSEGP